LPRGLPSSGGRATNIGSAAEAGSELTLCFAPGTRVLMADGSTRSIDAIDVGDWILSDVPMDGQPPEPHRVTELHRSATYRLFHIEIAGAAEVVATGRHPFWTERGWLAAEELDIEDVLFTNRGEWVHVTSIGVESKESPTYNLSVEAGHTFFVVAGSAAVLVHNVDPWDILYTQGNYAPKFAEGPLAGKAVADVAAEARLLGRLPDGLTLNAMRMGDGRWATLNNRTLAVAQRANLPDVDLVEVGDSGLNKFNRLLRDAGLSSPVESAMERCR
jgi:hypothetical protein